MTKKLIILLLTVFSIIYLFVANASSEVKKVYLDKSVQQKSENSSKFNDMNITKLDSQDDFVELSDKVESNELILSTDIIDLVVEEKLIQESIDDYDYLVENNLLNKNEDEENLMDSDFPDEYENTFHGNDEDDFIDANQFEKAQI